RRRRRRRSGWILSRDPSRPVASVERQRYPVATGAVGRACRPNPRRLGPSPGMTLFSAAEAQRVRLLGLDVDGVLTDNGVFIGPVSGEHVELKRFDIQDGLGLILFHTAGIPVVWVSGRSSEATALRAAELRVSELLQVPGP